MHRRFTTHTMACHRIPMMTVIFGSFALGFGLLWAPVTVTAQSTFCTDTANAMLMACRAETEDAFWVTTAQCINVPDPAERQQCDTDAGTQKVEGQAECDAQSAARLEVCGLVGEERYTPDFTPANFVDVNDIGSTVTANPYFPLIPGTRWVYQGSEETVTVIVTNKTKLIEGVTCRVVHDVVEEDGELIEDTDDWYAQDLAGNVWYCGESVQDFEVFAGDDPEDAERISIDGSFKTGRDGARPGILMLANPQVGNAYRQESALGEAEDAAVVLSITAMESVPAVTCNNDCLKTRDFTPLEPGVNETKYYARGIGPFLSIDAEGNRTELIEFTMP